MAMTKKHYEILAEAIGSAKPQGMRLPPGSMKVWERVVTKVADALAKDNPRFDAQRFRNACGVEKYE